MGVARRGCIGVDSLSNATSLKRSRTETQHYLTVEQYKYIRSLEAQGLVQDAMRENLRILDDAMRSRTLPALGLLETAWKGVGEAASWSWDKMLGLGRAETLEEKLAKAITAATAPARNGVNPLQADARRAAAQQLVEDLRQEIYQRDEANSVNSAATVKNQKAIED